MTSIRNAQYLSGNHYCVLSIAREEAAKYGIENSEQVEIKAAENGIVIQRRS